MEINQEELRALIREEARQLIRDELRIDVQTTSEYTGGMDDGPLYRDSHKIVLTMGDEVISETWN